MAADSSSAATRELTPSEREDAEVNALVQDPHVAFTMLPEVDPAHALKAQRFLVHATASHPPPGGLPWDPRSVVEADGSAGPR